MILKSQWDKLGSEVGSKSKELTSYINELETLKKKHDQSRGSSEAKENLKRPDSKSTSPIQIKF